MTMNYESSNAQVISGEKSGRTAIKMTRTSCAHRISMLKQKLCGLLLIAAAVFAVIIAEDMELLLGVIPVGAFLILTGKSVLTFNDQCEK